MARRSVMERARRSSFVTTKESPARHHSSAASSFSRLATEETRSLKSFSTPDAFSSHSWPSRPLICSTVEVRAYPTFIRYLHLIGDKEDMRSEVPMIKIDVYETSKLHLWLTH